MGQVSFFNPRVIGKGVDALWYIGKKDEWDYYCHGGRRVRAKVIGDNEVRCEGVYGNTDVVRVPKLSRRGMVLRAVRILLY